MSSRVRRRVFPILVTLLIAAVARADERVASEDFSTPVALTFGPDNLTRGRLKSERSVPYPFGDYLEVRGDSKLHSESFRLGPAGRGRLEDVVWVKLSSFDESFPGRRQGFTVVAFDRGGPEVRLVRSSSRPEAKVEWFDGTRWKATGAVIALDRCYRLRTVMDLDLGSMDIWLGEAPDGRERSLALGATFRAFQEGDVRRLFLLGRPTAMKVGLAAWQLWRTGTSELVRVSSTTAVGERPASIVRYAAPVTLEGNAIRRRAGLTGVSYTLRPVRGLRNDMELADVSAWSPVARVQRQTSFRHSGKWSLGISEGLEPVDTEVTLPGGDFEVKLHFLVPKELPPNRQVYLVRFKNPETGAEPIGPSVYLDYGASPGQKSYLIAQLRPDAYYAEEVDVKPDTWYGLRLATQRARSAYELWFVDADGTERAMNGGKPLGFFLGTSMGSEVLWRLFSLVSMRPAVTDWPKIDVQVKRRRVRVACPEKQRASLGGLTLRGLRADKAGDVDWNNSGKVCNAVLRRGDVIDKDWPNFRITPADAEKLKDYKVLAVSGNVYLPWAGVEFSGNTSGRMWLWAPYVTQYVPMGGTPAGQFVAWKRAEEKPRPLREGVVRLHMTFIPGSNRADMRAEVHWINPLGKVENSRPIPPGLFRGAEVELDHPGSALPVNGAAVLDDKFYLAAGNVGLEVYNRELLRTDVNWRKFQKHIGNYQYVITAFAWDPWSKRFILHSSSGRRGVILDREFKPTTPITVFHVLSASVAAGPDELYFVLKDGTLTKSDKFLATRSAVPVEKMFGGTPLFSAAACVDQYLYVATRSDSTILPSHVICIDTGNWNPLFSVDLKDKYPEVTTMTADGETLYLFDRNSADVAMFKLPPTHELAPQKTFLYVDNMELTERKEAQDIQLIPDPSGGVSGWTPPGAVMPHEKGRGWVVRSRYVATYDKSNIAYVGTGASQKGYLKLRTLDPAGRSVLYIDVRPGDGPLVHSVVLLYLGQTKHIKDNIALWGKTYTLKQFFEEKRFKAWWGVSPSWRQSLEGPVNGRRLMAIGMLALGQNVQEHVFSLEEDFGIKPGETVSGIRLVQRWTAVPILSLTLSLSESMPHEESTGTVTSLPVLLDASTRTLEWVSWEDVPFDSSRGSAKVFVRTAPEKYFMEGERWTAVENRRHLGSPLGRYLQWRLEMSTRDPWRPPGVRDLVFGLGEAATGRDGHGSSRWAWLLLVIPAAAAVAYFLIGRKSWWKRKRRAAGS